MNDSSIQNQRICAKLVEREVVCCVSMLVDHFAKNPEALKGSDYHEEDIYDLCICRSYLGALEECCAEDYDWRGQLGHLFDFAAHVPGRKETKKRIEADYHYVISECDGDEDTAEKVCRVFGLDPQEDEVYEHWVVSDFLARKLEEFGEVATHDFFGLTIWGRCTTGQAIYMDSVIEQIASNMEILAGQKFEWKD